MNYQNCIALFILFVFFSCQAEKKEENTQENDTETTSLEAKETESTSTSIFSSDENEYFPIKEGNSWTHSTTKSEYADAKEYTTEVIDENYTKNGKQYLTIKQTYTDGKELSTTYARTDDEGNVYSISPYIEKGEKEFLVLPADISIDKTWESVMDMTNKVTSTNATIETPAKNYTDCILIETIDKEGEIAIKSYYKKGIGSVAIVMSGKLGVYLTEYDLD